MDAEFQKLKAEVEAQQQVFNACDPGQLTGYRKTLAETWLADIGLNLAHLQRDVARLEVDKPPAVGMNQAWARYQQVFTALSPISSTLRGNITVDVASRGLLSVANRLLFILRFLIGQMVIAIVLLVYTAWLFSSFNPQTALMGEQLEARKVIHAHVQRIENIVDREARRAETAAQPMPAATAPSTPSNSSPSAPHTDSPNVAAVRGEVEGLAAALEGMRLAQRDVQSINLWLESVLVSIDADPPDFDSAKASLQGLGDLLTVTGDGEAPSLIRLTILGSLLGMITITIHLNWKWRNRWDTVGFLYWYAAKLIGAPVLSIAAVGLLSQVTFTKNVNDAGNGFADLGLRGVDPMLFFSIMILTGLFSNRLFDWLRAFAEKQTGQAKPGGAPTQAATAAADSTGT